MSIGQRTRHDAATVPDSKSGADWRRATALIADPYQRFKSSRREIRENCPMTPDYFVMVMSCSGARNDQTHSRDLRFKPLHRHAGSRLRLAECERIDRAAGNACHVHDTSRNCSRLDSHLEMRWFQRRLVPKGGHYRMSPATPAAGRSTGVRWRTIMQADRDRRARRDARLQPRGQIRTAAPAAGSKPKRLRFARALYTRPVSLGSRVMRPLNRPEQMVDLRAHRRLDVDAVKRHGRRSEPPAETGAMRSRNGLIFTG